MPEPTRFSCRTRALRAAALLVAVVAVLPPASAAAGPVEENGPDGKVRFRYEKNADDQRNGTYEELFPTGKPRASRSYTAGGRSGTWITRDPEGRTIESAGYRADKLEGPYVRYFPDTTKPML